MEYQLRLANRIRKARELADITQVGMAKELGISQQQYSAIEKGEAKLSRERLEKIAEVLGTTPEKIVEFDEKQFFGNVEGNSFHDNSIGNVNHIHENHSREVKEMYEVRITEIHRNYISRIEAQQKEIDRLHDLLKQSLTK